MRRSSSPMLMGTAAALAAMLTIAGACAQSPAPPIPETVSASPALSPAEAVPIAIVPVDAAATVTGALEITAGKAMIANNGSISSGARSTQVTLPRRGTLRVCASTTVHLTADSSVPAGETPGLMMALNHGALETSFATGRNADVILTPDFRILIGAPGSSDLRVRLGQHGDTCVDNALPANTTPGSASSPSGPYVVVTSVFDGGAYRVQPGQRVMFQHGSLQEVVDNEKEPCGCPSEPRPGTNDFPLAQSAGLAPQAPPVTAAPPAGEPSSAQSAVNAPLVYEAKPPATEQASAPAPSQPATAPTPAAPPSPPAPQKKSGFFHHIGNFFRKIFGAE